MAVERQVVTLREGNERVPAGKVIRIGIGVGPGMDETELHLVLRLRLAEFRTQNRGIFRFAQITGRRGRADGDVAQFPGLAERRGIGGSHSGDNNTSNRDKEQERENSKNCSTGVTRCSHGPNPFPPRY